MPTLLLAVFCVDPLNKNSIQTLRFVVVMSHKMQIGLWVLNTFARHCALDLIEQVLSFIFPCKMSVRLLSLLSEGPDFLQSLYPGPAKGLHAADYTLQPYHTPTFPSLIHPAHFSET